MNQCPFFLFFFAVTLALVYDSEFTMSVKILSIFLLEQDFAFNF